MTTIELTQLTDVALIAETKRVAEVERHAMAEGALTLSSVGLLAPHLTEEKQDALLSAAQHQSCTTLGENVLAEGHNQRAGSPRFAEMS